MILRIPGVRGEGTACKRYAPSRVEAYNLCTMFRTRSIKHLCRLILAALFLMQGMHLAQACLITASGPAMAFSQADHCAMQGKHGPVSPNVCLSQCLQGDQSVSAQPMAVPSAATAVMAVLPIVADTAFVDRFSLLERFDSRSPPPLIRFCSFRL
jgi:hypothetical protein